MEAELGGDGDSGSKVDFSAMVSFLLTSPCAVKFHGISLLSPGFRTAEKDPMDIPFGFVSRRRCYNNTVLSARAMDGTYFVSNGTHHCQADTPSGAWNQLLRHMKPLKSSTRVNGHLYYGWHEPLLRSYAFENATSKESWSCSMMPGETPSAPVSVGVASSESLRVSMVESEITPDATVAEADLQQFGRKRGRKKKRVGPRDRAWSNKEDEFLSHILVRVGAVTFSTTRKAVDVEVVREHMLVYWHKHGPTEGRSVQSIVSRIGKLGRQRHEQPKKPKLDEGDTEETLTELFMRAQEQMELRGHPDYLRRYLEVLASGRFPLDSVLFSHHLDCIDMFTANKMGAVRWRETTVKFAETLAAYGAEVYQTLRGPGAQHRSDASQIQAGADPVTMRWNFPLPRYAWPEMETYFASDLADARLWG